MSDQELKAIILNLLKDYPDPKIAVEHIVQAIRGGEGRGSGGYILEGSPTGETTEVKWA